MENCSYAFNVVYLERKKYMLLWGKSDKYGKAEVRIPEDFI